MSLRPFICNWLTGKEAFKCISVIVKTHNSADPLVEVSDFVHLQTLTEDTYRPVIIYRLKITEDLDCVAITIIWPTPPHCQLIYWQFPIVPPSNSAGDDLSLLHSQCKTFDPP